MSVVVLLVHDARPEAVVAAHDLLDWLRSAGHEARLGADDAAALDRRDLAVPAGSIGAGSIGAGADLAVTLGGDGTVLQAVGLLAECEVPVVGVNVGHLGYLTEFDVSEMTSVVQAALAGELPVEHRMMIQATVERGGARTEHAVGGTAADTADGPWLGLNEAVLEKRDPGHTVRMEVLFDGCEFATYAADGLIVSTPTGSTAYNLSAGGSVVDPTHRALQLTPVAPHMLFDRSILVGGDAEIRCRVLGTRSANLAVDGRSVATLDEGDVLVATRAEVAARLVTSDSMSFHAVLKQKLGLKDR